MPIIPFESAILRSKMERYRPVPPRRPLGPYGMQTPMAQPTIDPKAAWARLAQGFQPVQPRMMGDRF